MRKISKWLGTGLIIAGLSLMAIPLAEYGAAWYYQRMALAALEDGGSACTPPDEPALAEPETPAAYPAEFPAVNGIIEIPKISLKAVVVQGISQEDLRKGPGFYPQSRHPKTGNVSIAGHRGVYGAWFRNIDNLREGDKIMLTLEGRLYTYEVREQFITHDRDWSVVETNDRAELTLTTCLFTTTARRLIVKADLVKISAAPQPRQFSVQ